MGDAQSALKYSQEASRNLISLPVLAAGKLAVRKKRAPNQRRLGHSLKRSRTPKSQLLKRSFKLIRQNLCKKASSNSCGSKDDCKSPKFGGVKNSAQTPPQKEPPDPLILEQPPDPLILHFSEQYYYLTLCRMATCCLLSQKIHAFYGQKLCLFTAVSSVLYRVGTYIFIGWTNE